MIRVRYWSPGWGLQETRTTIAARTSMRPYPRTAVPRFPAEFWLRPVLAAEITSASQPFRAVAFAFFGQKRAMAYNSSARRLWTLHPDRQLTSAGNSRRASWRTRSAAAAPNQRLKLPARVD